MMTDDTYRDQWRVGEYRDSCRRDTYPERMPNSDSALEDPKIGDDVHRDNVCRFEHAQLILNREYLRGFVSNLLHVVASVNSLATLLPERTPALVLYKMSAQRCSP